MSSDPEIKVASYASKKGEVVIRPHEYDGIQEYDQTLPNWWLFIFYGGVVFFPLCWLLYYQFGFMRTDGEAVNAAMAEVAKVKARALDDMLAKLDDDAIVNKWARDEQTVSNGREAYLANCTACHGQNLSARMDLGNGQFIPLPGLPLTDGEWKYGAKPMDIFRLINNGTPPESAGHNGAKMEAWGQKMAPIKIVELVSFIIHENPKEFPAAGR
ncbi:MAG: cbb3-type cytochrome c oxidase N-terminal domain-containing protein [Verrucomicrobiota bacterium]